MESYDHSTAPNTPTGISPPPLFGNVDVSLERLTIMMKTPPSPTMYGDCNTISSFTKDYIPRSTSDRSLRSHSDIILSTTAWHSKYEHLHPRNTNSKPIIFGHLPKMNVYQTTHVDGRYTLSSVDLTVEDIAKISRLELRSSSYPQLHTVCLNAEIGIHSEINNTRCDSLHSLKSSIDEGSSQNLSEIDDIFIRPPPDIPITVSTSHNATEPTVQIQVVPIITIPPSLSVPPSQLLSSQQNVSFSNVPFKPVANKRNECGSLPDDSISHLDTISKTEALSTQDSLSCYIVPRAMPRRSKRCEKSFHENSYPEGLKISNQTKSDSTCGRIVDTDSFRNFAGKEDRDSADNSYNVEIKLSANSEQSTLEFEDDTQLESIPQATLLSSNETIVVQEFGAEGTKLMYVASDNRIESLSKQLIISEIENCGVELPISISKNSKVFDENLDEYSISGMDDITSSTVPVDINELMLMPTLTHESKDFDSIEPRTPITNLVPNHYDSGQSEIFNECDKLVKKSSSPGPDVNFIENTQLCDKEYNNLLSNYSHEQNNLNEFDIPLNQRQSKQQYSFQQEETNRLEGSIHSRFHNFPKVIEHNSTNPVHSFDYTDVSIHRNSGVETSSASECLLQDYGMLHLTPQNQKQTFMNKHSGNTEIRSARSIELIDRYPNYEFPHPPPPIYNIAFSTKSNVAFNPTCSSQENFLEYFIEPTPPPIPSTAPPELGDT